MSLNILIVFKSKKSILYIFLRQIIVRVERNNVSHLIYIVTHTTTINYKSFVIKCL